MDQTDPLAWNNQRNQSKYMKQWSQDTRYQKTKHGDPWEMENKQDKPYNCTSLLPGESFQVQQR